jgi:hypothetical protein
MTGLYLEKLRALTSKKGVGEAPSKPSKHSFESFEGAQGRAFSNFPAGYSRTMAALEARCPDLVLVDRWQAAIEDGRRFLARWGDQAEALGWTARDLFGLHTPPAKPHPSYSRLSRYDETGLIWLLQGCEVVALTEATAAIQSSTGAITTYRRFARSDRGQPRRSRVAVRRQRSMTIDNPISERQDP